MRASAALVLGACAAVLCAGCAAWDAEARARDRAREWLDCETIELARHSEHAWRAEGCGRHVDVACTTSDNEPECIRVRFPASALASSAEAEPAGEPVPDVEPEPERPAVTSSAEVAVRAAIDAARRDVLACVARERVVVRASWDASGALTVTLAGDLAGTPEEGCVRAALSALSAPTGAEGSLLHLVR